MASQLAAEEPYVTAFETTVADVDGSAVALDRTYFYAESGGQPSDRGTIAGRPVVDVALENGTTRHILEEADGLAPGDAIEAAVDPAFRRYCMSAHTASHAVYGAARQLYDSLGYGGFEISPEKVRIDLETPEPIDDEALVALERLTNQVVWEDRPVTWTEWPTEEVRGTDEIALNVATEVVETAETVRVVEIEDWDLAACGGTHVASTGEIGAVAMIDRSNPGEGMTRVEFVVGPDRVDRQVREKRAALAARRHLGVGLDEIPDRLAQMVDERDALKAAVAARERTVARLRLEGTDAIRATVDDTTWALATVDEMDASIAADAVAEAQGEIADVVALAGSTGRAYLAVATPGDPAAAALVDAVLDGFDGGGGGGSPTQAQAGGLEADPDAVIEHLRARFDLA